MQNEHFSPSVTLTSFPGIVLPRLKGLGTVPKEQQKILARALLYLVYLCRFHHQSKQNKVYTF
jgi:hypothetical protein